MFGNGISNGLDANKLVLVISLLWFVEGFG